MLSIAEQIRLNGIVPVIKFDHADSAVPLAETLIKSGLPIAEVTFRTDAAEESIRRITAACPEMLVGAGTVLTLEQVDRALSAEAQFIVAPGFNRKVVEYCVKKNVPVFPGCSTPSDIEQALELGLTHLKFFPAEQSGGLAMIQALAGPYPSVAFMATGGINEKNIAAYLAHPKVFACGGSWMVKSSLINEGRYDEIGRLVKDALKLSMGFALRSVGIPQLSSDFIDEAKQFAQLLMLPFAENAVSVCAGREFIFLKDTAEGTKGIIEVGVHSVDRFCAWAERNGFHFKHDSFQYDGKGRKLSGSLEKLISGFEIRFVNHSVV